MAAISQSTQPTTTHSLPQASADHLPSLKRPSSSSSKDSPTVQSAHSIADPVTSHPAPAALLNTSNRLSNFGKNRQSTHSPISSKQNRGGLFSLAALALDKTSSAIASFSEPSIRNRPSSGSLYRTAQSSPTSEPNNSYTSSQSDSRDNSTRDNSNPSTSHHNISTPTISPNRSETLNANTLRNSLLETNPPSQAYSDTAADTPAPIVVPQSNINKMHQTSSRLLRMTSDDRPFTRVRTTTYRWLVGCR